MNAFQHLSDKTNYYLKFAMIVFYLSHVTCAHVVQSKKQIYNVITYYERCNFIFSCLLLKAVKIQ